MAKKPQNLLKTVAERVAEAAKLTLQGPDLPAEAYTDAEGRTITPQMARGESEILPGQVASDPFLPDWDPMRGRGLVNPTIEQRKRGLVEFIGKGVGQFRTNPIVQAFGARKYAGPDAYEQDVQTIKKAQARAARAQGRKFK